ncbi:MAG: DEAD/DEAH box helicase family protein [Phycisphaerae bacterium]|nr:DEAD/DEAH box helicase family protein [Phycisphaerae bacterium]
MQEPQEHNQFNPAEFLGKGGPVDNGLTNYEVRQQQIDMSCAIQKAFTDKHHLVAEAGTGVGKSFAYLAAALELITRMDVNERVVISTYTIQLQEQLVKKDIPFIKEVSGADFKVSLAKGRSNYVCWRRLQQARNKGATLFSNPDHLDNLDNIYLWALEAKEGSTSEMGIRPPGEIWESICSDATICAGKNCKSNSACFYQLARRKIFGADIIVANHAILFSDLSLRQQGANLLPNYKHIIIDEAHNVEQVAGAHFGLRLTGSQVNFTLNRLYNPRTKKGLLNPYINNETIAILNEGHAISEDFFAEVHDFVMGQQNTGGNCRCHNPGMFSSDIVDVLKNIDKHLKELAVNVPDDQDKLEIYSYADRCMGFAMAARAYLEHQYEDYVYWAESSARRWGNYTVICGSPLDVGPMLNKALFEPMKSVVLTSATLSIKATKEIESTEKKGFEFFTSRIGLNDFQAIQLGSPFDYHKQVKVYVEADLPEPIGPDNGFMEAAIEKAKKYLLMTGGKAFMLFTSFGQLRKASQLLTDFCTENGLMILEQGAGMDRFALLNEFKANTNSILLGTDSFWQGVDVPGEALSNVMIFKLPFSVPDHPLLQARLELIRERGGNPFMHYQVPQAILKFRQGFGRLIRSGLDEGIVVVLDSRIVRKHYGKRFLEALPDCPVEIVREETWD